MLTLKNFTIAAFTAILLVGVFTIVSLVDDKNALKYEIGELKERLESREKLSAENQNILDNYRKSQKDDKELGQFVLLLMDQVEAKMSPARKQIVVQTVVRVANNIFENLEQKRSFAALLAIESKFNNKAKSPVKATGVAQIMPQYAKEFASICGIKDYQKSDLYDLELNMTIGACQFRALLESELINGNVASALVAYNAGKHSASFRSIIRGVNIKHPEPPNYVAKYTFLTSEVKRAFAELNKLKEVKDEKVSKDKKSRK